MKRDCLLLLIWVGLLVGCRQSPSPTTPIATSELSPSQKTPLITEIPLTATMPPPSLETALPVTPTPSPEPKMKELVICMSQEPESLYGLSLLLPAQHIYHAIYENLYTTVGFDYQAQGLVKIPRPEDGDVRLESITVQGGELILDSNGLVVTLTPGTTLYNSANELVTFAGQPLTMNQLVVDFTFKPMVWSDGKPVTADDSRFRFELQYGTDPRQAQLNRIARYKVTDQLSLQVATIPGWIDPNYVRLVWMPLPRHDWGQLSMAQLTVLPLPASPPLSSGAFMVEEWVVGEKITLVRNPHYYRTEEGLPYLDRLVYRFIADQAQIVAEVLAGRCHIATHEGIDIGQMPALLERQNNGLLNVHASTTPIFEHLDFGIASLLPDVENRPRWFSDVRVRQALTQCTDREAMITETQEGLSAMMDGYTPTIHPLYPSELTGWAYNPDAGNALLDELDWLDGNGDGIREDPETGLPFQVRLMTTQGGELRPRLANMVRDQWLACGVRVEVQLMPAEQFFADAPAGPIFGRQFDLALFAWLSSFHPPCHLYTSNAIPGDPRDFPASWSGLNVTGWSDPTFDQACAAANWSVAGTDAYTAAHQQALQIFVQNVPAIPLFPRVKLSIVHPSVQNFQLDTTQESELWNLSQLDLESTP